jgi:hypothetical protein
LSLAGLALGACADAPPLGAEDTELKHIPYSVKCVAPDGCVIRYGHYKNEDTELGRVPPGRVLGVFFVDTTTDRGRIAAVSYPMIDRRFAIQWISLDEPGWESQGWKIAGPPPPAYGANYYAVRCVGSPGCAVYRARDTVDALVAGRIYNNYLGQVPKCTVMGVFWGNEDGSSANVVSYPMADHDDEVQMIDRVAAWQFGVDHHDGTYSWFGSTGVCP